MEVTRNYDGGGGGGGGGGGVGRGGGSLKNYMLPPH